MEPFARHLEILLLDAVHYLTAFTKRGFFHKLMSGGGRMPQQRFAEIDQDITKCLSSLTAALLQQPTMQVAEVSAALEQLQQHAAQSAHLYSYEESAKEAVVDVQREVDRLGGLQGVASLSQEQLQEFGEALGVCDVSDLREEVMQCQRRIEGGVVRVTESVLHVKTAVAGNDSAFQQLCDDVREFARTNAESPPDGVEVDLAKWRLTEPPVIDRNQLLGTGAFGIVYAGTYRGQSAAFKVLNVNASPFAPGKFAAFQREMKLQLTVCACCPGVVSILAVALEADAAVMPEPCMVMERAIGSLHDYLHKQKHRGLFLPVINLSLVSKLTLALQVASAMEYISAAGLLHRSLKSSNVLIFFQEDTTLTPEGDPDVCAKICDFGFVSSISLEAAMDSSSHVSGKGSPSYLAPEAFDGHFSAASDVYAFGVLLNELLAEQLPHPSLSISQMRDAVCRDGKRPILFAEASSVGDSLRTLIQRCWCQLPEERCSFAQVTVELGVILHAALRIARNGSRAFCSVQAEEPPPKPPKPANKESRRSVCVTLEAVDTADVEEHLLAPPPPPRPQPPTRSLDALSVEEVGALMEQINLHALRDLLEARKVSGAMLQCCEAEEDLLCPEFGLQSRGVAAMLLKKIQEWRANGVPTL